MSVFTSLFSRDPKSQFAYDIPNVSFATVNGISMGKSFKKADPSKTATCFWASSTANNLKLQAQKLKTLRHPNVLTYYDSIEIDGTFYLITESCFSLSSYMKDAKFTNSQKQFLVSWGFFELMNCLKFLHDEAHLSHESIRHSVFVTETGDWKLSGFDRSSPFSDLNSVGILLWEVFNGFDDNMSKPGAPGKIPRQFVDFYKKCVSAQASKYSVAELLKECRKPGGFFKNRFVETLLFLEEFQLKDQHDKQMFFTKLKDELEIFPDDIAKCKILPKLIQTYEYGDAGAHILLPLFKLGKLLDEEEYQNRIVPCLCKLFSSPDRVTRVKLLEQVDEFAPHLTPQVVNERIYNNIASGFLDTSPAVRESTVKAMVSLADKLNYHNLNTDLMKYLARLQSQDDVPGIRTNTTICLGKIGCYIDPSQRQRILIAAFTRAMKDPFPPSRIAAVLALSATQQYYSLVEVANKILPALSPLTCDPEKQVRSQSFKALRGFLEKLEKASENPEMIAELEAQVQAGGKSGLLNTDKVPQWASWALKSLSGKFYKSSTPSEPSNNSEAKTSSSANANKTALQTPEIRKTSIDSVNKDGWDSLQDDELAEKSNAEEKWTTSSGEINEEKSDWADGWEDESVLDNQVNVLSAKDTLSRSSSHASMDANKKSSADGWNIDIGGDSWNDFATKTG
uniref:N-terminal kinase-like protein n=1 Tax=Syphacia muris TaxID=451379 RepID=A0A0N5AYC8_9BILA